MKSSRCRQAGAPCSPGSLTQQGSSIQQTSVLLLSIYKHAVPEGFVRIAVAVVIGANCQETEGASQKPRSHLSAPTAPLAAVRSAPRSALPILNTDSAALDGTPLAVTSCLAARIPARRMAEPCILAHQREKHAMDTLLL